MANEEYEDLESATEEYEVEELSEESSEEPTNIVTTFMKNFKARGGRL